MFETEQEMAELQALLDRSMGAAGAHLTSIVTGERTLNAKQVAAYLQQVKHISVGTVSRRGEPFVAPVDGWFLHGAFVFGTADTALRIRHLRERPAVSACHVDGDNIGIWVHGQAEELHPGDALWELYIRETTAQYGLSPETFATGIAVMRIRPRVMFAYAFVPENYPETPAPKA